MAETNESLNEKIDEALAAIANEISEVAEALKAPLTQEQADALGARLVAVKEGIQGIYNKPTA